MDNYVYISVKLYLEEGQTEDSLQEIVQEMDYSFNHPQITEHEIVDIMDSQLTSEDASDFIDPYDMSSYSAMDED
tara:strand:+ start:6208 stop:6432 length:225 start_codon:yes stop_codon:yes gene_type:complete